MEFKAAIMRGDNNRAVLEQVALKDLRAGEVLVRLVASGVCHSDLACCDSQFPMDRPVILGHEGSGFVERVGAGVTKVQPGDPVVMTFLSCGACPSCAAGRPSYCYEFGAYNTTGKRPDGSSALHQNGTPVGAHFFAQSSFAAYSVAHERNLVKVRADAPLELLGPLGCGLQTGAGAVMNALAPKAGDGIVVAGAGGVGLSAVMAAKVLGCYPIILIEPRADRRAIGLEVGATHAIDPKQIEDLTAEIRRLSGGGLLYAFDTSGINAVITQMIGALLPRGTIGLVAFGGMDAVVPVGLLSLISNGLTVRGIVEGDSVPDEFIPKLLDLFMEGRFPLDRLVTYYDLDHINDALDDQHSGVAIKPIVRIGSA